MRTVPLHALWTATALALSGCGGYGQLSGKVEVKDPFDYQGTALQGKVVVFCEATSRKYETAIRKDGTYSVAVPHGPARIALLLERKPTPLVGLAKVPENLARVRRKAERWEKMIQEHADLDTTPLTVRIEDKPVRFDITLALPKK